MPTSPENLAMFESDCPGAHTPGLLAKFHAPEIVFGPGALAELGHCTARTGARRPFLVTDPGVIEAGWVDEALAYPRAAGAPDIEALFRAAL